MDEVSLCASQSVAPIELCRRVTDAIFRTLFLRKLTSSIVQQKAAAAARCVSAAMSENSLRLQLNDEPWERATVLQYRVE